MLTFTNFTGINNVAPGHRLKNTELAVATNVDIGTKQELGRRLGYTQLSDVCHKNLFQAHNFMLATIAGNDLVAIAPDYTETVIYPSLGPARVWYCNLPDGRTTFSNGSINGITNGSTKTTWGVPIPSGLGAAADINGSLFSGSYIYALVYERTSDGKEGAPAVAVPMDILTGGLSLTGLPILTGYKINIYLSSHNDDNLFFAGFTTGSTFSFTAANNTLVVPLRTSYAFEAPIGTVTAFWRGRVLLAQGSVLYASSAGRWEAFDIQRDFKQFSANITLIQAVDNGVFVGTEQELAYLSGTEFDKLTYTRVISGRTVLGSGVSIPGELIKRGDGTGTGSAMICIADRILISGSSDGNIIRLTEGRYTTSVTEVASTFRTINGIPQYIAIPQ